MSSQQVLTDTDGPPIDDERTFGFSVPDFFQETGEDALRSQVQWLEQHLGVSDLFFARFLRAPEPSFRDWRLDRGALAVGQQNGLEELWRTVLHLLSFADLDGQRVRGLLERPILPQSESDRRHPLAPPWSGSSLKSYLEERGADGLPDVDRWVTGFRFGNPYAS